MHRTWLPILAAATVLASCSSDGSRSHGKTSGGRTTPAAPASARGGPTAFPTAAGFGATARGGRGGKVCRVTSLAKEGAGSLAACLSDTGPRTVVFAVSGVIDGPLEIPHGQLTIAGQTSPGGITVRGGLVCDNVYDPNDCNDVVIRHLRLRGGAPDGLRIGGARDIMVDHCSMGGAEDENIEITRSSNVTIQSSIVAEPRGEHYKWGGVLINYSKDVMPLDNISLHHNLWSGVSGRLPELSCEENGDGPGTSNCRGHVLHVEITNNVYWDVFDPIWFNRCTGTNEGNDCRASASDFKVALNLVGNVMARRSSYDAGLPFVEPALTSAAGNDIFGADNILFRGAVPSAVPLRSRPARHAFPALSTSPSTSLVAEIAARVGPKPRDAMDSRLTSYLARGVDARPVAWANDVGIDQNDSFAAAPAPAAPPDADADGMPDAWESSVGLDPKTSSANDATLAGSGRVPGCSVGYTALECYLNQLAPD